MKNSTKPADNKQRRHKVRLFICLALTVAAAAAAGLLFLHFNTNKEVTEMGNLTVKSSAFEDEGRIPKKYAAKGEDISPPLSIGNVDPKAKTIAVIVDDPDAPTLTPFVHWVVFNIPANITEIPENIAPGTVSMALMGASQGKNTYGRNGYDGPNPPSGTHTYRFIVYTLDTKLDLKPDAGKKQLEQAMAGHILQTGILRGRYGA